MTWVLLLNSAIAVVACVANYRTRRELQRARLRCVALLERIDQMAFAWHALRPVAPVTRSGLEEEQARSGVLRRPDHPTGAATLERQD